MAAEKQAQTPAEEAPPIVAGAPLVSSADELREQAQQTVKKPAAKRSSRKGR
jgi:hypothetical protein